MSEGCCNRKGNAQKSSKRKLKCKEILGECKELLGSIKPLFPLGSSLEPPELLPDPVATCVVPINGSWLMKKELLGLTMAIPRKMDSILFERPPLILKKVEQFSLVCSIACLFTSFFNSWVVANGLAIWSGKTVVKKKRLLQDVNLVHGPMEITMGIWGTH